MTARSWTKPQGYSLTTGGGSARALEESSVPGRGEYRQRIRFALAQLRSSNDHYVFERLCRHLARATIATNILPATGPVGAGGDQGRDFETYRSLLPGHVGSIGQEFGLHDGGDIAFLCTLRQEGVTTKILGDVTKVFEQGFEPSLVVAYCEKDVSRGGQTRDRATGRRSLRGPAGAVRRKRDRSRARRTRGRTR